MGSGSRCAGDEVIWTRLVPTSFRGCFLASPPNYSAADKLSLLDKFRALITEIGNALGFVRMVRSAAMRHASQSVSFVPDIALIPNFTEAASKGHFVGRAHRQETTVSADEAAQAQPTGDDGRGLSAET